MPTKPDIPHDHVSAWRRNNARDYAPVEHGLPVREESITQIGTGEFLTDSALVSSRDTALYRVQVGVRSVGVTVLDPDYLAFVIPVSWQGEYILNGEAARSTRIYMPGDSKSFYIRGDSRETFGVVLRRDQFIETVAALRGIGPEDVNPNETAIELTSAAANILRMRLAMILDQHENELMCQSLDKELFGLITDAYLSGCPEADSKPGRIQSPERIVRKAEERFMAAVEGEAISLADLCAAAGVSKSALYTAFHNICGDPPIEYFRKRRFMRARSILLKSSPQRGAVKRSALEVGFTELGRFSVEYRRLFGESPSATLRKAVD